MVFFALCSSTENLDGELIHLRNDHSWTQKAKTLFFWELTHSDDDVVSGNTSDCSRIRKTSSGFASIIQVVVSFSQLNIGGLLEWNILCFMELLNANKCSPKSKVKTETSVFFHTKHLSSQKRQVCVSRRNEADKTWHFHNDRFRNYMLIGERLRGSKGNPTHSFKQFLLLPTQAKGLVFGTFLVSLNPWSCGVESSVLRGIPWHSPTHVQLWGSQNATISQWHKLKTTCFRTGLCSLGLICSKHPPYVILVLQPAWSGQ